MSALNYLAGHNQLAWMGYFLGVIGILVAVACIVRIGMQLVAIVRARADP